ncbi:DUF4340 domain-containing protein [bacterium]|nr:DUF4340 domain-containing protein [bacterium]
MKTRPLFILGAVLLVLIGLKFVQRSSHESKLSQPSFEVLFPAVATGDIGRLVIDGPGAGKIELTRSGMDWRVDTSYGHPAAADKLERLLGGLVGLRGEFRSDRESVLADYALDEKRAVHLIAYDLGGKELGHLLLGERLSGAAGCFAMKAGEKRAYAAGGNLLGDIGVWGENREPSPRGLLDLGVFSVDRQQVNGVALSDGDKTLTLAKTFDAPADTSAAGRAQYRWLAGKKELDRAKTDALLGALASIRATDVLDPAAEHGFAAARRGVELSLADGSTRRLEFGAPITAPEAGIPLRVGGAGNVYLVYDKLPERVFKSREDLLPDRK